MKKETLMICRLCRFFCRPSKIKNLPAPDNRTVRPNEGPALLIKRTC